jgi:Domain of unknown function (DUF4349)
MRRRDDTAALTPAALRDLDALDRALAGQALDSEYGDLEMLVQAVGDDAPRIDREFADRLDQSIAEGFARGGLRTRLRSAAAVPQTLRRHGLLALGTGLSAAVAAAIVVVVAGGGSHGHGAPTVKATAGRPAVGQAAAPAPTPTPQRLSPTAGVTPSIVAPAPAAAPGAGSPGATSATGAATRDVQRNAELTLSAPRGQLQRVSDRVVAATDRFGGIVASSNVSVDDQGGSQAAFELQLPTAKLDAALAAYSALAHVSSRSESSLDITDQTRAASDRLTEARAERLALLRQLAKATTPNQVASIHAQLGLVAGRIQQDDQDLRSLQRRASYATLQLTVTESQGGSSGAGTGSWGPGDAANSALDVLRATLGILLVAAASLVPLGLLALPAWWAAAALRRHRREQALGPLA